MKLNLPVLSGFLLVFGLALYSGSWHNPFVLDDMAKIQWNTDVTQASPSFSTFFRPYAPHDTNFRNDPSRPLTYFIYWFAWHLDGGQPEPFRVLNVLLHILGSILVSALAWRLSRLKEGTPHHAAAFVAGTFFLISPLLAGSVLYAFALSDLLATVFILLALLNHLRTQKSVTLECLLFALAVASKQSAIVLPALLVMVDLAVRPVRARTYAPTFVLAAAYLTLRYFYLGGVGDLEAHGAVYARGTYALVQGVMIFKYIGLLLSPQQFSLDHFVRPEAYSTAMQIAAWGAVLVLGFALYIKPRLRPLAWGWSFFVICLLPTSSIFPTVDLFVERRAYLPAVGIYLALGALFVIAWRRFARRGWHAFLLVSLLLKIVLNSSYTLARTKTFASPQALWEESLNQYIENPRARLNLATVYSHDGRFREASDLLEALLVQQPTNGVVYSKLAFIFAQVANPEHDFERAWQLYQKSYVYEPNDVIALLNGASLQIARGQAGSAEALWGHVLQINPQMPYAHFVAGQGAMAQGQRDKALAQFHEALALDPNFTEAHAALTELEQAH